MDINNHSKQLLQFLRRHFGGMENFSLDDYLHAFGKESNALLYWSLFFPELVEVENRVFLNRMVIDKEALKGEINNTNKSISEIEKSYNFIEIGYLFDCEGRDIIDEEELLLAEKIKVSWGAWLKIRYPSRHFLIEILTPEQTGSTVGVQFYESLDI